MCKCENVMIGSPVHFELFLQYSERKFNHEKNTCAFFSFLRINYKN